MKIDYIRDGAPDCPIVRLCNFTDAELQRLREICLAMARSEIDQMEICSDADPISSEHTRLTFVRYARDRGIVDDAQGRLSLMLTADGWIDVACRIRVTLIGPDKYQWLWKTGDVRVLLSWDGRW
jgi:hypothetical protein